MLQLLCLWRRSVATQEGKRRHLLILSLLGIRCIRLYIPSCIHYTYRVWELLLPSLPLAVVCLGGRILCGFASRLIGLQEELWRGWRGRCCLRLPNDSPCLSLMILRVGRGHKGHHWRRWRCMGALNSSGSSSSWLLLDNLELLLKHELMLILLSFHI